MQAWSSMWMDALDGGPGLRPEIMFIGDAMILVLTIAADPTIKSGAQLVLRCQGNEVSAAISTTARQRPTP